MKILKFIFKTLIVLSIIILVNSCSISYGQMLSKDISINNVDYLLKILVSSDSKVKLISTDIIRKKKKIVPQDSIIIPTKDMMIKPSLAEANSDPTKGEVELKYFHKNDIVKVEISSVDNGYSNIIIDNERYAIKSKFLKPVGAPDDEPEPKDNMRYIGKFQLTAYAWTGNRCANGKYPSLNKTVAAHKSDFTMGTRLYIEGYGYYTVEDRGGFPRGVIDVYLRDHNKCVKFGRKHGVKVYVVK